MPKPSVSNSLRIWQKKFSLVYLDPTYNTGRNRGRQKVYTDKSTDWSAKMMHEKNEFASFYITDPDEIKIEISWDNE
ncbi:MAG: hypothetical protein H7328_10625 [Bdellovibrio sp.]|nr:hypothetical protein [Bdellovibrio sp.]